MHRNGDLRSDDFAVRPLHFLATSTEAMSNKFEQDHSSFLESAAENVKVAADAKLPSDDWRHIKHILSHGGRQKGTRAAHDVRPFMTSEGVEITEDSAPLRALTLLVALCLILLARGPAIHIS